MKFYLKMESRIDGFLLIQLVIFRFYFFRILYLYTKNNVFYMKYYINLKIWGSKIKTYSGN